MNKPSLLSVITSVFGFGYSRKEPSTELSNSNAILPEQFPEEAIQSNTENSFSKVKFSEKKEYSLATAQWTPEWPKGLEERLENITSSSKEPDSQPNVAKSQILSPKDQHCQFERSLQTPQYFETTSDMKKSANPRTNLKSAYPSSPMYSKKLHFDTKPRVLLINGNHKEASSSETEEELCTRQKALEFLSVDSCSEAEGTESQTSSVSCNSSLESSMLDVKTGKWLIELGNNRNYIKALVNNSSTHWATDEDVNFYDEYSDRKDKKGRWIINYDNLNYIRSQLNPKELEKVLSQKLKSNVVGKVTFCVEGECV